MATAEAADEKKKAPPRDPAREVVETIVFVVVLVLLLKLFVTEAFVIPTGSMAETLYGYQRVIACQKCGHEFPVNAHDEVEPNAVTGMRHRVYGYNCPNCRYRGLVDELNPPQSAIPNSGDRVLVLKPLYHVRDPQRGDVVVFKYPEKPQENHVAANYIKRAMGFGGETIAVHRGELYATTALSYPADNPLYPRPEDPADLWKPEYRYPNSKQAEDLFAASRAAGFTDRIKGGFQIVRKGEAQLLADRRIVWDNDKQPTDPAGNWKRWAPMGDAARWKADSPARPTAFAHTGDQLDWLRYQHLVWRADKSGRGLSPWRWGEGETGQPVAGPIDNMLGYNAGRDINPVTKQVQSRDDGSTDALRWVGDLILECEVELAAGAEVTLELSKGSSRFQAKFGNNEVVLTRVGAQAGELGKQPCKVSGGVHKLRFANVDHRLWVWVDGKRIDFGATADYSPSEVTAYDPEDREKEGWSRENDIDQPARIGAKGQVSRVSAIKLHRDVYYTRSGGDQTEADIYYVQPSHYLCLGDNSAQSSDSRRWGLVPERLMLGKAVFVFFPVGRIGFIK
jgi:signal peptidase I